MGTVREEHWTFVHPTPRRAKHSMPFTLKRKFYRNLEFTLECFLAEFFTKKQSYHIQTQSRRRFALQSSYDSTRNKSYCYRRSLRYSSNLRSSVMEFKGLWTSRILVCSFCVSYFISVLVKLCQIYTQIFQSAPRKLLVGMFKKHVLSSHFWFDSA